MFLTLKIFHRLFKLSCAFLLLKFYTADPFCISADNFWSMNHVIPNGVQIIDSSLQQT